MNYIENTAAWTKSTGIHHPLSLKLLQHIKINTNNHNIQLRIYTIMYSIFENVENIYTLYKMYVLYEYYIKYRIRNVYIQLCFLFVHL